MGIAKAGDGRSVVAKSPSRSRGRDSTAVNSASTRGAQRIPGQPVNTRSMTATTQMAVEPARCPSRISLRSGVRRSAPALGSAALVRLTGRYRSRAGPLRPCPSLRAGRPSRGPFRRRPTRTSARR
jgi:hypothetical protein